MVPGLGDHDILLVDSNICATRVKPPQRTVYLWGKANESKIREETETFSSLFDDSLAVEDMWQSIHGHLTTMLERHVPTRQTSQKTHKSWITTDLKRASRRKYRAWKRARKTNRRKDWNRYKLIKKETRSINRRAQENYTRKIIDQENSKGMWRLVKSRKCDPTGIAPLKKNGLIYNDKKSKADILNDQFCSVFTDEDTANMPRIGNGSFPAIRDIDVSYNGVLKLIRSLNPSKAAGPDGIPCRLLVMVAEQIAHPLTCLFQSSLNTGTVPQIWKHAHVAPIYKKGDRSAPGNYRPISLTCVCCKLLEHIVRAEVTKHLEAHMVFTNAQHGFRKGRSCESQLVLTIHDLVEGLDAGEQTDAILLDFSKAFDRVPHQRLLLKLEYYGIRGTTLSWISQFLSGRSQQVLVEGELSGKAPVTSGVPQGSVLGPSLFLVYINDLPEGLSSVVRLFADDTIVYRCIKSVNDCYALEEDLLRLEKWEEAWQMGFNVDKCSVLTISKKKNLIIHPYTLHQHKLERVQCARYLGVEISHNLSWRNHIEAVVAKANRAGAFVARNLQGCPEQVQAHCFRGMVRPVLEYASSVWDPHQQYLIDLLESVQRRAARRIVRDFSPTTSASELLSRLNIPLLGTRRQVSKATLLYKVINGHTDWMPPAGALDPALRSFRGRADRFLQPRSRTDAHRHSFFPSAVRMWNSLPSGVSLAPTVPAFKSAVEGWLG